MFALVCEHYKRTSYAMEPPLKKQRKVLLDGSSDEDSGDESGGMALGDGQDFKINKDFARRFEHNKKREELQKCAHGRLPTVCDVR